MLLARCLSLLFSNGQQHTFAALKAQLCIHSTPHKLIKELSNQRSEIKCYLLQEYFSNTLSRARCVKTRVGLTGAPLWHGQSLTGLSEDSACGLWLASHAHHGRFLSSLKN